MGIDNAFCENNTKKAIYNLLEYYQKCNLPLLLERFKSNISVILDTKIKGESLFDILVRYSKNNISLLEQSKNYEISAAFKGTKYDVCCSTTEESAKHNKVYFRLSSVRNSHAIVIATDPGYPDEVTVKIKTYPDRGNYIDLDNACFFFCIVAKKENGKYRLSYY